MVIQQLFFIGLTVILLVPFAYGECDRCYDQTALSIQDSICLVIDRSGSMKGLAMNHAKQGAMAFVDRMDKTTSVSVISFSNTVEMIQGFTSDRKTLKNAISAIQVCGNTALYDAVAFAALKLQGRKGRKMVVFLTDGRDNRSRYTLPDLRSMNISEGIFVYGIGLGDVDQSALAGLCMATGGTAEHTVSSNLLLTLYPNALTNYYTTGINRNRTGDLVIRSLPDNRSVFIDGKYKGHTPLAIRGLKTGMYNVSVRFEHGKAMCVAPVQVSTQTCMDLRPPVLGRDLIILTRQAFCSIFIDGTYMGTTGAKKRIHLSTIPEGQHSIKLIGMPDFDYGPEQMIEIPVTLSAGNEFAEIRANVLGQKILKTRYISTQFKAKAINPFAQLEREMDDF